MGDLLPRINQNGLLHTNEKAQRRIHIARRQSAPIQKSASLESASESKHGNNVDYERIRLSKVLSDPNMTRWIATLTPRILRWLNKEIKMKPLVLNISASFCSGYNFAQLMAKLGYPIALQKISRTKTKEVYMHNFSLLQPAFQRASLKTNMALWKRVADGVPGAALWVLSQLFDAGNKSSTTANSDHYDYSLNLTSRDETSTTTNDTTAVRTASRQSTPTSTPRTPTTTPRTPTTTPRTPTTTPRTPTTPSDRPHQHDSTGEPEGRKDWSCCHEFRHQPLDAKHLARHLIRMLLLKFATVSEATGRRCLGRVKTRCMQTVVHKVLSTAVVALVHLNKRRWAHEENKKNDLMYDVKFLNGTSPINFIAHQLMRHNQNITGVQDRTPTLNLLPRAICQSQFGILMDQMSSYERAKLLHSTWKSWFNELWTVLSREYRKIVAAEISGVSLRGGNIPIYIIRKYFAQSLAQVLLHPPGAQTPVRAEIAEAIEPGDVDHLHQELELMLPTLHRHSLAKSELRVLLDHMINSYYNVKKANFFGCPNSPMPLETKASLDTFMLHIASSQIRRVVKAFNKDPKEIFNSMDTNGDGVLSLSELETGLSSLGDVLHDNPKDAARSLHEALSRAGDNDKIDIHTFERFVKQYMKNFMKDRVQRAMKTLFARRSARFTRMLNVAKRRVTEAEGKRSHVRQMLARTRAQVKKALEFGPNVLMPDKYSETHKAMQTLYARLERAEQLIEKSVMHQQLGSDEISNACNFNSMRLNMVATSKLALAQQCIAMSEKLSNDAIQAMGATGLAQRTAQTLRNEVLKKDAEWRERRAAAIQTAMSRQRGEGRDHMTLDDVIAAVKGSHSVRKNLSTRIRKKRIAKAKRKGYTYDYNAPLSELWSTQALDHEASVMDRSFAVDWARIRKKPSFHKAMTERCGRDVNEIRNLKFVMKEHHQQLVSLFDHYRHNALSQGNQYFTMGVFFIFLKECRIINKNNLDRRQACVCFQLARPDRKGPAKLRRAIRKDALLRYNFLELIIHLALHKHGMLTESPSEALKDFLEYEVFAHGRDEVEVNGLIFREKQLQDPKIIAMLEKHKTTLMEIFAEFSYYKVNKRRKSSPGEEPDDGAGDEAQEEDGNPHNQNPTEAGTAAEESSQTPERTSQAPHRLDQRHMKMKHWTKFCEAAKLIGYGGFSARLCENCFYLSLAATSDELHHIKVKNMILMFKGFVESIGRIAYSMQFPTDEELTQAGANNIVEFNSRRKHVTRFHLEISKQERRREMPFEKRLSMLLEIITAVLPSKIHRTQSKNKRASKGVNSMPKGAPRAGTNETEASTAHP